MKNKYFLKPIRFILLLSLVFGSFICPSHGQPTETKRTTVRRALLIGISEYNKSEDNKSFGGLPSVKNDINAMETLLTSQNYQFEVKKLENENATRDNILKQFEDYLIKDAKNGDVSLFYFSGHGSQVTNSLGGESDGKDETFVPFDVKRPVEKKSDLKDIRDKEINALLNKAVEKGVKVIFIADSCHSGSIGRDDEEVRKLEPALFDVKEPVKPEQKEKAVDRGVLVISAAQDFQRASSSSFKAEQIPGIKDGTVGNLTANLLLTLYETPADLISAENLFNRVSAKMRANGLRQIPDLDATPARKNQTLFGGNVDSVVPKVIIGKEKNNDELYVLAGLASGLSTGSELVRVQVSNDLETEKPIRIRLTNVGLNKSEFEIVSTNKEVTVEKAEAGDFFKQVSWGASTEPYLTVWMPTSNLTTKQVEELAFKAYELRNDKNIEIVDSIDETAPTHFLFLDETNGKTEWILDHPRGESDKFDDFPTAKSLNSSIKKRKSPGNIKLLISLPPSKELIEKLSFGEGQNRSPIAKVKDRNAANYRLVGRANINNGIADLEYAWVLPTVFETAAHETKTPNTNTALPFRSDWVKIADVQNLQKKALGLAKIRGWLNLSSPPTSDKTFPYRLELRTGKGKTKVGKGEPVYACEEEDINKCEGYDLILRREPDSCKGRFSVYVLTIDQKGKSFLVYPRDSNDPIKLDCLNPKNEVPLTENGYVIFRGKKFDGTLGIENYILIITDTPISNKYLLEFDEVRTEDNSKSVNASALDNLLLDIGAKKSSRDSISTPDNWFVQQLTFESKRKEKP